MSEINDLQSAYQVALHFAALKHEGQDLPGTDMPYLVHPVTVAMEVMIGGYNTPGFDMSFGVVMALLHDTMEDTETSFSEVKEKFGERIAEGVLALTKFTNLEKTDQMKNSVQRIKSLEKEVWCVKLADRIANLQAPQLDWNKEKRKKYKDGAEEILTQLGSANEYLSNRLRQKIIEYSAYVISGEK